MIAVDTNLLVYAHRRDSTWHEAAESLIRGLAEGTAPWALPWCCLHEFVAIATHPRIFRPASSLAQALEQVQCWLESPSLVLLGEAAGYWSALEKVLRGGQAVGPLVHDARVAAVCQQHGVSELWSADRDFGRFPMLKVLNPLVEPR